MIHLCPVLTSHLEVHTGADLIEEKKNNIYNRSFGEVLS